MDKTVPPGAALLLDFIYLTETSRRPPECYEVVYGHNQAKLPKPLTSMTLEEVIRAQASWTKRFGSSAAGAPQLMRKTLIGLMEELGLRGSQRLDADLQDRLGLHLLKRRGYDGFMAGTIGRTEFGKRLAQEWASFPVLAGTQGGSRKVKRGQSFYTGDGLNKSLVMPDTVEALLDRVKKVASIAPPPVDAGAEAVIAEPIVIEKSVVADPGELEQHPLKSKTVWQWVITSVIVPMLAVFQDWRVQLAIVLIIAAFAIYAIKRRVDLFKAVKGLKAELGG